MDNSLADLIGSILGAIYCCLLIGALIYFCIVLFLFHNKREDQRQKYLRDLPEDERLIIQRMFDNDLTLHQWYKNHRKKKRGDLNEGK